MQLEACIPYLDHLDISFNKFMSPKEMGIWYVNET